jgi:hypothetical protein
MMVQEVSDSFKLLTLFKPFSLLFKRPQIKQGYPLNLSILISGGKESNSDFLSSGERRGRSSALKSEGVHPFRIVAFRCIVAVNNLDESSLEWDIKEGDNPVYHLVLSGASRLCSFESSCLGLQL